MQIFETKSGYIVMLLERMFGYIIILRNKQSRKYLISRYYKNDEFDWPFLFGVCIIA